MRNEKCIQTTEKWQKMDFRALKMHKKTWYEKNKKKEKENEKFKEK